MNWLDLIILVWLVWALLSGLKLGFVYKFGTTIGFLVGLYTASRYTPLIAEDWGAGPLQFPSLFLFIMSFVSKSFGLVAWLLDKAFHFVARLPLLKTLNRVGGGILGLGLACFMMSSVFFVASEYAPKESRVANTIDDSAMAEPLISLSIFYKPFLSERLNEFIESSKEELSEVKSIPAADIEPR